MEAGTDDCNVKVTYALSPQAKGKIERPTVGYRIDLFELSTGEYEIHVAQEILRHEVTGTTTTRFTYNLEVFRPASKMLYLRRSPCFESSLSNLLNPQRYLRMRIERIVDATDASSSQPSDNRP